MIHALQQKATLCNPWTHANKRPYSGVLISYHRPIRWHADFGPSTSYSSFVIAIIGIDAIETS